MLLQAYYAQIIPSIISASLASMYQGYLIHYHEARRITANVLEVRMLYLVCLMISAWFEFCGSYIVLLSWGRGHSIYVLLGFKCDFLLWIRKQQNIVTYTYMCMCTGVIVQALQLNCMQK